MASPGNKDKSSYFVGEPGIKAPKSNTISETAGGCAAHADGKHRFTQKMDDEGLNSFSYCNCGAIQA
jgi:hypothetical protein